MRILILGAGGMLGHKMCYQLSNKGFEVFASFRTKFSNYSHLSFYNNVTAVEDLDITNKDLLIDTLNEVKPNVIINCIGVTTRKISNNKELIIYINSLLPHQLDNWASNNDSKLIHFSTDCVFNGKAAVPYSEKSDKTASDLYGQSKSLGEVSESKHSLTLRSSIIGNEINHFTELVEWMISQNGKQVSGYQNVMYSGVTTNTMAKFVEHILRNNLNLSGLYQIASEPISKLNLIKTINNIYSLKSTIRPDGKHQSYKVLDGSEFVKATGLKTPTWNEMISELFNERKLYKNLYNNEAAS